MGARRLRTDVQQEQRGVEVPDEYVPCAQCCMSILTPLAAFTLLISIRSRAPILPIHLRFLERAISFVTGVSTGRIRIVAAPVKRSAMQDNTLEAELTVYPSKTRCPFVLKAQHLTTVF